MATETELRDYLKRATVELTETRRQLTALRAAGDEPLAIVGMACRFPGGADTLDGFWSLLADGRTGVVDVPAERFDLAALYDADRRTPGGVYTRRGSFLTDVAGWDAGFFGHSPQEALRMDPHQRLLMELVHEGFDNAGIAPARAAGTRTGVFVGHMDTVQYGRLETERHGPDVAADPYFGQGVSASLVAGRLAYHYDLRGPAMTLDTACSSSLVGVHLGGQALRRGECDLALAAGSFLILQPDVYVQGCATSMLSPDGRCKTFDAAADGYVLGEGAGLVVLERLSTALAAGRRIHAVVRGSAVNQDGRSNGLTAPSRGAQVDVVRRALAAAGLQPADIDYVEAHGSGTQLGDAIELSALHDVFGDRPAERALTVGAAKTALGHTQAAAGVAGLIKTVLILQQGRVPANLHGASPAAAVPADGSLRPATVTQPLAVAGERARAGVSSFGWSGTNAHVVLEAAPPVADREPAPAAPDTLTLALSAADPAALAATAEGLADWLAAHPDTPLGDVAHTLAAGRSAYDFRLPVAADEPDAVPALRAAAGRAATVRRSRRRPRVAFLLTGTGDQYVGAAQALYRAEPVFAAAVDRCLAVLQDRCGVDLRDILDPPGPAVVPGAEASLFGTPADADRPDPLERADLSHPYVFTLQYGLAALLAHHGVEPDLLLGYSLGEYVAACLAGVLDLGDALYVVVERARLIAAAPAGRMLAVAADEDMVRAALAAAALPDVEPVDVAAVNGPAMTVLSGTTRGIEAMTAHFAAAGVAARPLRSAHAFHSALLEPAQDKLAALWAGVARHEPTIPIVGNRTGAVLTPAEVTDPEYWAGHLVAPVRFADGVRSALVEGVDLLVELGCGQTLGGLVRQVVPSTADVELFGTLPAGWAAAGLNVPQRLRDLRWQLWQAGVQIDLGAEIPAGRIVGLPSYPFQRTTYWPEPRPHGSTAPTVTAPDGPTPLAYGTGWRRDPLAPRAGRDRLPTDGPVVLLHVGDPVGEAVARFAGDGVLAVRPGARSTRDGAGWTVDPTDPTGWHEFLAALPETGPITVLDVWSQATAGAAYDAEGTLDAAIRVGFAGLQGLLRTLGERAPARPVRLLTVSRGALEILGGDAVAPQQSIGHGLGRSARHEYPTLTWSGVDLDPDADTGDCLAQLVTELALTPAADTAEVAGWRRGRRWQAEPVELALTEPVGPVWRTEGSYLITGGTRGLGLTLARHLVAAGVRRLALVSRGGEPVGDEPAAVTTRADLAELRQAGVDLLVVAADTGRPGELRAALARAVAHFGRLTGVVHAAGLPASGLLAGSGAAAAERVLAPKVRALAPLAELLGPGVAAPHRPELLVLYSSAITAYGGIGESDYCAANTVLDAYAAALAAGGETRVLSVGWGPWQHDAWQAPAADPEAPTTGPVGELTRRARDYRDRFGFTAAAGCALLDRLVGPAGGAGGLRGPVLAVGQPLADIRREWAATLDLTALTAPVRPTGERFPRPALRVGYLAPRGELEATVAETWGAFLGLSEVGVHDPFFDLGGNSLVGLAMVHALEQDLGREIPPALLYAHPTVAEFAAALATTGPDADQHAAAQAADRALRTSTERGQRRRARSTARRGGTT